mmetsp:Transcript_9114/g.15911  ORF Transcript_9114/g.15911 Transcript_9114/m.15911 type:complete len:205 (+) Transcript_9114:60-674(+)|eukprot:CAMPEP_0119103876 /NCGR_PEP_ID=MMETSP1180-20130426/2225_1 /TAXON_ID=3052 ORGANISM="Chlamydomonas cf sp, Strain CCMP681" /NCGR_SAMPLE_ID=MMETSP1180 /ASSEMBLY_ACC=CAM_ASM_000741 /LENGTH=204 /DNA_ID=CAMNT_0007088483 /DNA_START=60 /DNA_END=674 /DNA_ORIENTATION=-
MATDEYDHIFKVLLVGDSGVGKSCLLLRFTQDRFQESTTSTIGVDFKVKYISFGDTKCKLTIWDTAGQERFRTLTSSYYRGAQGVILVYDVSRRETFDDLSEVWLREVDMYTTIDEAVKMVVANKTDLEGQRQVSTQEGQEFAKRHGCLFVETSAKANVAVTQAFDELVRKILETPALLQAAGSKTGVKLGAAGNHIQESNCSC